MGSIIIDIMNHSNQNTSMMLPFSTRRNAFTFGTTTIITTPWGC
ncbi:MAG: hypothetical protein TRG1_1641 [Flavobacteriaceae bacterium FS1-H7996/R]|nr:MAG: hypothetical protein TRG1_1641 [Flavobacteriaceae bacterium FS1-H7996/R]